MQVTGIVIRETDPCVFTALTTQTLYAYGIYKRASVPVRRCDPKHSDVLKILKCTDSSPKSDPRLVGTCSSSTKAERDIG